MKPVFLEDEPFFPTKIVCVGRNYVAHIRELQNAIPEEPVLFLKPNSAISGNIAPPPSPGYHFEGEICFLFHQGGVAGVGLGLDLTNRALQNELKRKGLPWEKAKAFDGAVVFSKFVPFSGDFSRLRFTLKLNDVLVQEGAVSHMIYPPEILFREIRRYFTLENGDVVMTGTPAGVGEYHADDRFVGTLYNGEEVLVQHIWKVW